MGVSWLKKYLANDSCYCPLLLDVPNSASNYITNINCSELSPSWDCVSGSCLDFGYGNGFYSTLSSCLIDSCLSTNSHFNPTIKPLCYPNPAKDVLFVNNSSNNSVYKIISVEGRTVLSGVLNNNSVINISLLNKGFYYFLSSSQKISFIKI